MVLKSLYSICFLLFLLAIACGTSNDSESKKSDREIWMRYCQTCHGLDGKFQGGGSPDITQSKISLEAVEYLIKNGKGKMLPFKSLLNEVEIERMAKYVLSMRDNG